jgi:hypothetical protein
MNTVGRSIRCYERLDVSFGSRAFRNAHEQPYLCEQLKQIPAFVKIDQNVEPLERLEILFQLQSRSFEPLCHRIVVSLRNLDELHTSGLQISDSLDDIVGAKGDMLYACAAIEVDVLFYLRLLLALGWLVNGHFDNFIGRRHYDRLERGKLGADVFIVDAPEAVESERFLVVLADVLHLIPVLVAHAVVYCFEGDFG